MATPAPKKPKVILVRPPVKVSSMTDNERRAFASGLLYGLRKQAKPPRRR